MTPSEPMTAAPPEPAPSGVRARNRAELTQRITEVAREHLARDGAAALSLRAVAREIGLSSSAVYRYFPTRDDLLTVLIVDAYDGLGEAAEASECACRSDRFRERFLAACHGVRAAALARPAEFALVYGSPVPGYAAPETTIGPALRVAAVLARIVEEAAAAGVLEPTPSPTIPETVRAGIAELHATLMPSASEEAVLRGVMVWTHLFGAIGFELFGHRHKVVGDYAAFFDVEMSRLADFIGLQDAGG